MEGGRGSGNGEGSSSWKKDSLGKNRRERDGEEERARKKTSKVGGRGNALANC